MSGPLFVRSKTAPAPKHTPPAGHHQGERDAAGVHRYWCEDCGTECTAGTKAGPPHLSLDQVIRCERHRREHGQREAKLRNAAADMGAALRALLGDLRHSETWGDHVVNGAIDVKLREEDILAGLAALDKAGL